MTTPVKSRYDVGGIRLPRPFRVRRLGHVGVNAAEPEKTVAFYARMLGFRVSDVLDFRFILGPERAAECGPMLGYFLRHGTEHHSWVIFPRKAWAEMSGLPGKYPEIVTNQITWQVGSLREVADGHDWLEARGRQIFRSGRDTPGSNWNVYPVDTEGHVNELFYGIEQIGWMGAAKPPQLHQIRYQELPGLPHRSEYAEVQAAQAAGVDLLSGTPMEESEDERYDVGGVLLGRPFKVTKIGPVRLFVKDVEESLAFYRDELGLSVSEEVDWHGYRCVFLRANTEHHSLALYPRSVREELGLDPESSLMSMGFQVAEYSQLRDAVAYLERNNRAAKFLPPELSPGIDYSAFFADPDGRLIQLYYYMEQVGWDGRVRPVAERARSRDGVWPETIDGQSDTYLGETFLGPWG